MDEAELNREYEEQGIPRPRPRVEGHKWSCSCDQCWEADMQSTKALSKVPVFPTAGGESQPENAEAPADAAPKAVIGTNAVARFQEMTQAASASLPQPSLEPQEAHSEEAGPELSEPAAAEPEPISVQHSETDNLPEGDPVDSESQNQPEVLHQPEPETEPVSQPEQHPEPECVHTPEHQAVSADESPLPAAVGVNPTTVDASLEKIISTPDPEGRAPGILGNPPEISDPQAQLPWGPPVTRPLGKGQLPFPVQQQPMQPYVQPPRPVARYPADPRPVGGPLRPPQSGFNRPFPPPRPAYPPYPDEPVAPPPRAYAPPPSRPVGPHQRPMYLPTQPGYQPLEGTYHGDVSHPQQHGSTHDPYPTLAPYSEYPSAQTSNPQYQQHVYNYSAETSHTQSHPMANATMNAPYQQLTDYRPSAQRSSMEFYPQTTGQSMFPMTTGTGYEQMGQYLESEQQTMMAEAYDQNQSSAMAMGTQYGYESTSVATTSHMPYGTLEASQHFDSDQQSLAYHGAYPTVSSGADTQVSNYNAQQSAVYSLSQEYSPSTLPAVSVVAPSAIFLGNQSHDPYLKKESPSHGLDLKSLTGTHSGASESGVSIISKLLSSSLKASDDTAEVSDGRRRVMHLFEAARRNQELYGEPLGHPNQLSYRSPERMSPEDDDRGKGGRGKGWRGSGKGASGRWQSDYDDQYHGDQRPRRRQEDWYDDAAIPTRGQDPKGRDLAAGGSRGKGSGRYKDDWRDEPTGRGRWGRSGEGGGGWKGGPQRDGDRGQRQRYTSNDDRRWEQPDDGRRYGSRTPDKDYDHPSGYSDRRGRRNDQQGHRAEVENWQSDGRGKEGPARKRCPDCARIPCNRGRDCTFSGTSHLQQYCHTAHHQKFPCRSSKSTNQRLLHAQ